jgi:hypothetical protein
MTKHRYFSPRLNARSTWVHCNNWTTVQMVALWHMAANEGPGGLAQNVFSSNDWYNRNETTLNLNVQERKTADKHSRAKHKSKLRPKSCVDAGIIRSTLSIIGLVGEKTPISSILPPWHGMVRKGISKYAQIGVVLTPSSSESILVKDGRKCGSTSMHRRPRSYAVT